jgi:hypothetical protein
MRARLLVPIAGLCLVALAAVACGGETSAAATNQSGEPAPSIKLPSRLLGLKVTNEDISSSLQQNQQAFIDSVGLFAFRRSKDVLEATMQVSRFSPGARPEASNFRGSIISRIGGTNPRVVRVGKQSLYLTSGRDQVVFVWFKKRGFFVLTVRRDYAFPRTLLRRILESNPEV